MGKREDEQQQFCQSFPIGQNRTRSTDFVMQNGMNVNRYSRTCNSTICLEIKKQQRQEEIKPSSKRPLKRVRSHTHPASHISDKGEQHLSYVLDLYSIQ